MTVRYTQDPNTKQFKRIVILTPQNQRKFSKQRTNWWWDNFHFSFILVYLSILCLEKVVCPQNSRMSVLCELSCLISLLADIFLAEKWLHVRLLHICLDKWRMNSLTISQLFVMQVQFSPRQAEREREGVTHRVTPGRVPHSKLFYIRTKHKSLSHR